MLLWRLGEPLHVGHDELATTGVEGDPGGIPPHRDQTGEPRLPLVVRIPVDHRDGVLRPVADIEPRAVGGEGQRPGLGPEQVRRSRFRPHRPRERAGRHVEDRDGVGSGAGADDMPAIGADGQRRRMLTDDDLGASSGGEIDDAHTPLAGDMPDGINPNRRPLARGADRIVRAGTPPPPVADEGLATGEDDIERRHADIEGPQHLPGAGIDLVKPVGEIATDIEAGAVGADGQPGRDLLLPLRRVSRRERDCVGRGDDAIGHGEHLHRSVDIAHIEPPAIGSEAEAGEALDRRRVGLEVAVGVGRLGDLRGSRLDTLPNVTRGRIDDDDLVGLPRSDGQLPVGREGDGLGAETGELDLPAPRREHLIDRRDRSAVGRAPDRLGRPVGCSDAGRRDGEEQERDEKESQWQGLFHGSKNTAPRRGAVSVHGG